MLDIRRVDTKDRDLHGLIAKLDEDLYRRYPADEVFVLDFNDPDIAEVRFIVAYDGERPVGCGAIRPLDDEAVELKRFYVEPEVRRRGVAARMLAFLEDMARELGYEILRLETGTEQPEANAFYQKHGYVPIPLYGEYVGCPSSLCYEKKLALARA
ncbi:GNAT family N-acetyltransferase [Gorillibacterium sp. sgz5001074]|uniref:GNAT family N-acetyltransferase n=1 Tax=Gorillibacterium sp. sgz5001074 TaxID=3446695 RepID=UPI003F662AE1